MENRTAGRDDPGVPHLTLDAAEEPRVGHRRVVMIVHVTSSDQHAPRSAPFDADHAVGKQACSLGEEDHVVWFHEKEIEGSDQEDIAGPDERQHARTRDANARFAAAAQQFCQQMRRRFLEAGRRPEDRARLVHLRNSFCCSCTAGWSC